MMTLSSVSTFEKSVMIVVDISIRLWQIGWT